MTDEQEQKLASELREAAELFNNLIAQLNRGGGVRVKIWLLPYDNNTRGCQFLKLEVTKLLSSV